MALRNFRRSFRLRRLCGIRGHQERSGASPIAAISCRRALLSSTRKFTALVTFNDVSAIGAIRAFKDAGWTSLGTFQSSVSTTFTSPDSQFPGLPRSGSPLMEMGKLTAEKPLQKINAHTNAGDDVLIQPELIVRESTAKRDSWDRAALHPP